MPRFVVAEPAAEADESSSKEEQSEEEDEQEAAAAEAAACGARADTNGHASSSGAGAASGRAKLKIQLGSIRDGALVCHVRTPAALHPHHDRSHDYSPKRSSGTGTPPSLSGSARPYTSW